MQRRSLEFVLIVDEAVLYLLLHVDFVVTAVQH